MRKKNTGLKCQIALGRHRHHRHMCSGRISLPSRREQKDVFQAGVKTLRLCVAGWAERGSVRWAHSSCPRTLPSLLAYALSEQGMAWEKKYFLFSVEKFLSAFQYHRPYSGVGVP